MGSQNHGPLNRRQFTRHLGLGALTVAAGPGFWLRASQVPAAEVAQNPTTPPTLPNSLSPALLRKSPFVYISPLHADGKESTCHAELWYAWLDDSVIVTVASDRWKATALARGLDRARIWVGDHGRWKTWYGGRNEDFRGAPQFEAQVSRVTEAGMIDRLLAVYEDKYPAEVADWRDLMREGNANGSRVILRYSPTRHSPAPSSPA